MNLRMLVEQNGVWKLKSQGVTMDFEPALQKA